MANLMEFCEALSAEGWLAADYVLFRKETKSKKGKQDLKKLEHLSREKMKILHGIIKDNSWVM